MRFLRLNEPSIKRCSTCYERFKGKTVLCMYFHVVFLLHSAVQEFWHLPVQTVSQVMTSLPHKVTKKIFK